MTSARSSASVLPPAAAAMKPGTHMPVLDGVRGVAILLVLIHHLATSISVEFGMHPVAFAILGAGWVGVDLFFVLSGFLITGILVDARGTDHYFRNFYTRRALRIFPLYYGSLVLAFALAATFPAMRPMIGTGEHSIGLWLYLTNIYLAFEGWDTYGWISHFWSLAIEEHFYLVWPVLVYALPSRLLLILSAMIVCGGPVLRLVANAMGAGSDAIYLLTFYRADSLACGGLLALVFRVRGGRELLGRWSPVVAIGAAAGIILLFVREGGFEYADGLVHTVGFSLLAALFGSLIVQGVLNPSRGIVSLAANRAALRGLGKYSYGLYVFHTPIFTIWFHTDLGREALEAVSLWSAHGASAVAITTSAASALISYHLWEQPFLRLKSFFTFGSEGAPGATRVAAFSLTNAHVAEGPRVEATVKPSPRR